jgi:hypothetical protein
LETLALVPHPDHPPVGVRAITATLGPARGHWLPLRWRIEGAGALVVPAFAGRGRADGLWRTTCFELFLAPEGGDGYCEFNLSPSERWAAYDFAGYRDGMVDRAMPRDAACALRGHGNLMIFDAALPLAGLPARPCHAGLSAVIEEAGGRISYWALAHPVGKADFHHPACFATTLAAPLGP